MRWVRRFRARIARRTLARHAVALQQYYTIAAASTEVSTRMGALARERIGGLQGIFSEPPKPRLTLFGERFDPACGALRRFLERNQITFEWVTPDSPDVMTRLAGSGTTSTDCALASSTTGRGCPAEHPRSRPAARPANPSVRRRIRHGDHRRRTRRVGLGGLRRLRRAAHARRRAGGDGGQAGTSSRIENYLGFPGGVSGDELARRALMQARRLGAEILVTRSITRIDPTTRHVFFDGDGASRSGADVDLRDRRRVATSRRRRHRPAHRQRRLLRRRTERDGHRTGARHPPHRRRQLGGAGRDVLRRSRTQRDARRPRPRPSNAACPTI